MSEGVAGVGWVSESDPPLGACRGKRRVSLPSTILRGVAVMLAKAGIQGSIDGTRRTWTPCFRGAARKGKRIHLSGSYPQLREARQHLLREQGQVVDRVLMADEAALAHHQEVPERADVVVKGL